VSADPYYQTPHWRQLRAARLKLDRHVCVVPGCGHRATTVDHILRRRDGGSDTIDNTRSLCKRHDGQVKEGADGKRKSGGKLTAIGCNAQGLPNDPAHWWNA
jgi:5-methylcytosine-specific restriction endonuclease McrA